MLTSLLTVNIPFEGGTLQWNPALTKCHGTEKIVLLGGGDLRCSEDPDITNYLVKSKNIRHGGLI